MANTEGAVRGSRVLAGQASELPTAVQIAGAVRSGTWSAADVIQKALDRTNLLNSKLNALVAFRFDEALAEARRIDERVLAGLPVGRLAGVPFTVKDTIATDGLATTCGSAVVPGRTTDRDAVAVARLRAEDAVLVGKTNCSEFAMSIITENPRYGATTNPLGPFTVGGSSGGESASVAAGMSAFGIGTDFGGSLRWPAQCTGVLGLRPTVGRVPATGQLPAVDQRGPWPPNPRTLQGRIQVIGAIGRSVDDLEMTLRAMAGPDGLDSYAVPVPLRSSGSVRLDRVELRFGHAFGRVTADEQVAEAVEASVGELSRKGMKTIPGLPPALDHAQDIYDELRAAEPLSEIRAMSAGRHGELTESIRRALSNSVPRSDEDLAGLWTDRDRLRHDLLQWLHGNRLLALPVAVVPPFVHGAGLPSLDTRQLTEAEIVAPCRAVALFGLPAISVPCGFSTYGAPLSVQFVAPPFREDLLLAVARSLMSATHPGR
ncbi:MAG TPA: amidase [Jatrophihabitans sp.]